MGGRDSNLVPSASRPPVKLSATVCAPCGHFRPSPRPAKGRAVTGRIFPLHHPSEPPVKTVALPRSSGRLCHQHLKQSMKQVGHVMFPLGRQLQLEGGWPHRGHMYFGRCIMLSCHLCAQDTPGDLTAPSGHRGWSPAGSLPLVVRWL